MVLIKLANVPIAAPSANASTKPSPTAAEHVAYDLDGRIETIIDGGPCDVGVESTVVDGLSQPPLVLRPGGISIEQLRSCPGWEHTEIGYKNASEIGSQPRAPGMKYRHYAPRATVVLYEVGKSPPTVSELERFLGPNAKLGLVRTKCWQIKPSHPSDLICTATDSQTNEMPRSNGTTHSDMTGFAGLLEMVHSIRQPGKVMQTHAVRAENLQFTLVDISLGADTADVARGIFAALRELDKENVDAILVEGIDDAEGETAAAIMNRLRKAAEIKI